MVAMWAGVVFSACSSAGEPVNEAELEARGTVAVVGGGVSRARSMTKIPVSFDDSPSGGFGLLAAATAYTIQLSGCLSGYSATVTEANLDGLEVYKDDQGCLAKLTHFAINGKQYYPTAADPFMTWQAGDVARFDEIGEPGVVPLYTIVTSTLSNPVVGTDIIKYGLAAIDQGKFHSLLWSKVGASAKIIAGVNPPPSFTVRSVELIGNDLATGAGKFKFVLECTAPIGITNVCVGVNFADMDYRLVKDVYSDAPSQAQSDTIFSSGGAAITLPGDRIAPGNSATTNGGFQTVTLTGPVALATSPNMIFMIRSYLASYQYFNVDTTIAAIYPDATAPAISSITTAHENGIFTIGEVIDIDVNFDEPITLTGTASTLSLNSGGSAVFYSKPAAAILRYRYTVLATHATLDLGVTAFTKNTDSIRDAAANNAVLTLPTGANTLAGNAAIVIDTEIPAIATITTSHANGSFKAGEVVDIDVAFNESVTLTGTTSTLTLNSGGTAVYQSKPSATVIRYRYTALATHNSADLDVTALNLNTDTIRDGASNNAYTTLPVGINSLAGSAAVVIDTTAPTIATITTTHANGSFKAGEVIDVDVTFSESVTLTGTASTLSLNSGGSATYQSKPSATVIRYRYTVLATENSADLDVSAFNLSTDTIRDAATNDASLMLPSGVSSLAGGASVIIDTTAPTITGTTSSTIDGSYRAGQTISIQVTYSETVLLAGTTPGITLSLETGATDRLATYVSGSGTAILSFNYLVVATDISADLTTNAVAPQLVLTGTTPTLLDAAGNTAPLTIAGTTLAANKAIVIDTTAPPALGTFSGLTCCTINSLKANAIQVRTTFPATVTDIASVIIRRAAGATAPADCISDTLVTTLTGPFTGSATTYYTDDTGVAGATYSYRACVTDLAGNQTSTNTFASVVSAKFSWIFATTSSAYTGNLGGIAAADAACTTAGAAIDSTLAWGAVLSTSTMNAAGHVPVRGSVYNYAATPVAVATSYATMWGSAWATAVTYDQSGAAVTGNAWTGSTGAGAVDRGTGADAINNHCANWTSALGGSSGRYGSVTGTTAAWATSATQACSGTARLYCVSKAIEPLVAFSAATGTTTNGNINVTVTFPAVTTGYSKVEIRRKLGSVAPTTACTDTLVKTYSAAPFTSETFVDPTATTAGAFYTYIACLSDSTGIVATTTTLPARAFRTTAAHAIFITTSTHTGNLGGLVGGDALCQTAGNALDSTKTWQFIGSDSVTDAVTRLVLTGDVRNVNGVLLATSEADFFDGTLTAAVSLTDAGVASIGRSWTGSLNSGVKYTTALYCTNWTDATTGVSGRRGRHSTTATYLDNQTSACNTASSLYCISSTAY